MLHARNVEESLKQLEEAQTTFLYARKGMGIYNPKDAWEDFKKKCQQLSQWIEHGKGVTDDMKPALVEKLFAAEKILLDNKQYEKD